MALPDAAAEASAATALGPSIADAAADAEAALGTSSRGRDVVRVGGGGTAAARALTRRPGALPSTIVVDVREFMSTLPAVLHGAGLALAPTTLEVGDYVLTPSTVIERKAIPDLRASLASGRLLTQAGAMVKHYPTACLLIEFDGDKPFSLAPPPDPASPPDAAAHTLPARLALLITHAPRLRLLWARSSHDAARLFRALKEGCRDEPDAATAAALGAHTGADAAPRSRENTAAVDLLRRLPGVTDANWRALAAAAGSLAGVAAMETARLVEVMGGAAAARRLRTFLDQPCPSL